jgi:hypothetical protein
VGAADSPFRTSLSVNIRYWKLSGMEEEVLKPWRENLKKKLVEKKYGGRGIE